MVAISQGGGPSHDGAAQSLGETARILREVIEAVGESSDSNSVSSEALLAGAVAVVAAAVITALAVYFQTKRTLAAEKERLEIQLANDRAIREREELRGVLDEAVARIDLLTMEMQDVKDGRERIESERDTDARLGKGESEEYDELLRTAFKGIGAADTLAGRLALRLGQGHEVVQNYRRAWSLYNAYLGESENQDGTPDGAAFGAAGRAVGDFMRQSYDLFGTELVT